MGVRAGHKAGKLFSSKCGAVGTVTNTMQLENNIEVLDRIKPNISQEDSLVAMVMLANSLIPSNVGNGH